MGVSSTKQQAIKRYLQQQLQAEQLRAPPGPLVTEAAERFKVSEARVQALSLAAYEDALDRNAEVNDATRAHREHSAGADGYLNQPAISGLGSATNLRFGLKSNPAPRGTTGEQGAGEAHRTESPQVTKARALLREHAERFLQLYSSSGFSSPAALRQALTESPALATCYQQLLDEKVEFAMWQPRKRRDLFTESGFLNQFSTSSSQGMKSRDRRNNVESNHLWTDRGSYSDLDPKVKPKYAYLRAEGSDHDPSPFGTDQRPDIYIFKKSALKDRVTCCPGDSLDRGHSMAGDVKPDSWDEMFVPWEHRELLAPLVFPSFSEKGDYDLLSMKYAFFPTDAGGVNRIFRPLPELPGFKLKNPNPEQHYVELQLWGDLSLDDVEAFEFRGTPPKGEFLEELLRRGIRIVDRRAGEAVPWAPPDDDDATT